MKEALQTPFLVHVASNMFLEKMLIAKGGRKVLERGCRLPDTQEFATQHPVISCRSQWKHARRSAGMPQVSSIKAQTLSDLRCVLQNFHAPLL